MGNGYRQPLGRLTSDLIAATLGLTVITAAAVPAVAQELEQPDATATVQGIAVEPAAGNGSAAQSPADHHDRGINWRPVLSESLLFLAAQHLARFAEDRTVNRLGGPFVNDWFDSVRSLNRFSDGGKIRTNWVAHPMMGSVATHILGQNDPEYWRTRSAPATATGGPRVSSSSLPPCIRCNSRSGRCRNPHSGTYTRRGSTSSSRPAWAPCGRSARTWRHSTSFGRCARRTRSGPTP